MRKEIFDIINNAGLFELYGAKIEEGSGVYVTLPNGEREKVTMSNVSEYFDLPRAYCAKPEKIDAEDATYLDIEQYSFVSVPCSGVLDKNCDVCEAA